jgi:sulfite exporter TauE/SafE
MWQVFIAGASLGMVSSFHCVGMCGPLLMALPVHSLPARLQKAAVAVYHAGRLGIYTLLGALFGIAGRHIYMAGLQQWLSIGMGVIILLILLVPGLMKKTLWQPASIFFSFLQTSIQRLWQKTSIPNFLLLGALNGLLPCGMVYFALAAALNAGNITGSTLFMLAFGLATLPLLVAARYIGSRIITLRLRNTMRRSIPLAMAGVGILLVLRGLNLGIPYISPYLGKQAVDVISCH